jgi:hypothetical protein
MDALRMNQSRGNRRFMIFGAARSLLAALHPAL